MLLYENRMPDMALTRLNDYKRQMSQTRELEKVMIVMESAVTLPQISRSLNQTKALQGQTKICLVIADNHFNAGLCGHIRIYG